jgi:hypothetical protein
MATCCHSKTPPRPQQGIGAIVRFGRNVASYKFALGQALLDLAARQQTFVPLPELAVPYAAALCKHLRVEDRQSTSAQSQFLDACRRRNRGDLDAEQLAEATVRLGFANVIDAFHVSRGGQPTQTRFFVDERASRQGITLTDHLLELANGQQAKVLPLEVDARWNLVQMSWGLRLGTRLVSFDMATDEDAIYGTNGAPRPRPALSSRLGEGICRNNSSPHCYDNRDICN